MSNLKGHPVSNKYQSMNKHLNILTKYLNTAYSNKNAFRNLWGDTWHRIGIEWPKNRVPGEKFVKRVYHADSESLKIICQLAEDCGLRLINRIDEDEIELIAPGAEDYSIIIARAHYDDGLFYDYSDLEGLSISDAIGVLKARLNKEIIPFDYIYLHFKISSEFAGLRTKILIHPPQSEAFREFLMDAKLKLESTVGALHNAIGMSEEPIETNAQAEHEVIIQNLKERCAMMMKRHAFLTEMVSTFNDFDTFMRDKEEWCSTVGFELTICEKYLEITIHLDSCDYETYFAHPSKTGYLTISKIVRFQDNYCANTLFNITTQKVVGEDEILAF